MPNSKLIINFAIADRKAEAPVKGNVGGSAVIAERFALQGHFGKRLLDALSWLSETWKISIIVKNETTVDALWICIFHRQWARERR